MGKKIKVEIYGMNFYVVGENDEAYVKSLAKNLDTRIKNIESSNYKLNNMQSVILAALNILDEKEKLLREDRLVENASTNNEEYRKNLKELEILRKEKQEFETLRENFKKDLDVLKNNLKNLEQENKDYREKDFNKSKEINKFEDELIQIKKEKDALEEQIYESQKRIIDLSREIESLNEK